MTGTYAKHGLPVVVIGGGPVGLATADALSALAEQGLFTGGIRQRRRGNGSIRAQRLCDQQ
jgi:threonine dehydrogenase-like Zn-dependent dehydrogenase